MKKPIHEVELYDSDISSFVVSNSPVCCGWSCLEIEFFLHFFFIELPVARDGIDTNHLAIDQPFAHIIYLSENDF